MRVRQIRLPITLEGGNYTPSELRRAFRAAVCQALMNACQLGHIDQAVRDELSITVVTEPDRRPGGA